MQAQPDSQHIYRARVERTVAFISTHLTEDLSLARLAQVANFSRYHFHRIFSALMDETPHDFVQRVRLEQAANYIQKSPARAITEIALGCGFSSPSTFARAFKAHFGVTASDYRGEGPARPATRPARPAVPMRVAVKPMPQFHVAYVSNLEGYDLAPICRAWDKLRKWATIQGLLTPETQALGLSFDDPAITPEDKCRYFACLTVPEGTPSDPLIGVMDIPAGRCMVGRCTCEAAQIQSAYRTLYGGWLPGSGYQPADRPCYELYHATPETHPEGQFVLDICLPVVPL